MEIQPAFMEEKDATVAAQPPPQLLVSSEALYRRTRLENLADELLVYIAQWVNPYIEDLTFEREPQYFAGSLLNLALCSRRLYRICEPILYQYIRRHAGQSLLPLLRTIVARPDLAFHVRVFGASGLRLEEHSSFTGTGDTTYLDTSEWRSILLAAEILLELDHDGYNFSGELDDAGPPALVWGQAIKDGYWDAAVALLVIQFPSLHTLLLEDWRGDEDIVYIQMMFNRAAKLQRERQKLPLALQNLRTMAISCQGLGDGTLDLRQCLPFLALPCLKKFSAYALDEDSSIFTNWTVSPLAFQTEDLVLANSWISPILFEGFLLCFTSLKSLYYKHSKEGHELVRRRRVGREAFEPPLMLCALKHLQSSLQKLTILNETDDCHDSEFANFPIGSLLAFTQLISIEISISAIIGEDGDYKEVNSFPCSQKLMDCLPRSLKHLSIHGIKGSEIVSPLAELLRSKNDYTPTLKTIDLHWEWKPLSHSSKLTLTGLSKGHLHTLRDICKAADVQLILELRDFD